MVVKKLQEFLGRHEIMKCFGFWNVTFFMTGIWGKIYINKKYV